MAGQKDAKSKEAIRQAIMDVIEKRPKATLRTLKAMGDAEGDIGTAIVSEDSNLDYGRIATLFTYAANQLNPNVTEDDVLDIIDLDCISEAMSAVSNFFAINVPEGLIPPEMLAEEADEDAEGAESKN